LRHVEIGGTTCDTPRCRPPTICADHCRHARARRV
jgi:hypothetical protein